MHTQAHVLSQEERTAITQLAQNIPALWQAPTTTIADRKDIVRQIIQRVVVQAEGASERLHVTIEWIGGGTTAGITTRPIQRTEHLSYYPARCERIQHLAAAGQSTVKITACLAQEGFRSPKQDRALNRQTVIEVMRHLGVRQPQRPPRPRLGPSRWRFSELADELGRSSTTLHLWRKQGWLTAQWNVAERCWVVWADAVELERLKTRCLLSSGEVHHAQWLAARDAHVSEAFQSIPE